jgi:Domain of unknown function (DUF4145)
MAGGGVFVINSIRFDQYLNIERCPYCGIDKPNFIRAQNPITTKAHDGQMIRNWAIYSCGNCGGVVTASALPNSGIVLDYFPKSESVSELIPEKPRRYLKEAITTVHAPSSSIMVCASAVDAMLKEKEYKSGTLYERIGKANKDHLITDDMAAWAHQVRLDANSERHVDEDAPPPTSDDARKSITFAKALAEFLFVLPAKVSVGLQESKV